MGILTAFAFLIGLTGAVLINENVVFQKTNDITTTRAKWLASFIIDLQPFSQFIGRLEQDIYAASLIVEGIVEKYKTPGKAVEYLFIFRALQKELQYLNSTRLHIWSGFLDYQLLHTRAKRSPFDFIGSAASWLFGLVSQDDLKTIKRNIMSLAQNQQQIIHVVKESVTVLNMTRFEVAENRQAIAELITTIHNVDVKLERFFGGLNRQVHETQYFLEIYLKLDLIISEIKDMIQNGMFYLEHLRTQLNFLSLGRLSPSTISPLNLRSLLLDIKAHLPPTLALIGNPRTDLWLFYRQLSTTALLDENKIVAVINIPVLQISNQFEVYRVYSLPLPTEQMQTDNSNAPDMTASFKLEARGLMIDKGRTKYALLSEAEVDKCSDLSVKWCNVESPLFPVNLAKLCIVNLFLRNQEASQKYCQSIVTLNTRLPLGLPLFNSMWAIALQNELRFSFVCNESVSKTETVTGPLSILEVPPSCVASNDYMILSSSYTIKREYKISDTEIDLLRHLNISQFNIWSPFVQNFSNFTTIPLPEPLRQIQQIPLGSLINQLQTLHEIDYDGSNGWPTWAYVCLGVAIAVVILICIYLYRKYGQRLRETCSAIRSQCGVRKRGSTESHLKSASSTNERQNESTVRDTEPSAPTNENFIKKLYPMLFEETTRL